MDGLPTELVKLCRLASMAECGDHFWENVPTLGLWAAVWMPVSGAGGGGVRRPGSSRKGRSAGDLQPGV